MFGLDGNELLYLLVEGSWCAISDPSDGKLCWILEVVWYEQQAGVLDFMLAWGCAHEVLDICAWLEMGERII